VLTYAVIVLAALAAALAGSPAEGAAADESAIVVYVGTYTHGESRGIYRFALDPVSGEASVPVLAAASENPSFLALHPGGRFLYAVNETDDFGGEKTGAVSAFAIDSSRGELQRLNQQPSKGAHPCHLVLDEAGKNVLVANYSGGNVTVLPIGVDGRLRDPSAVLAHVGSGPSRRRQEGPHAHGLALAPDERFAFAADLGADRVFVHRFDPSAGTLEPNEPSAAALAPGSGPRHVVFHPSGTFLFAINELLSTVTVFRYKPAAGVLEPLQTLTTLPADFDGTSTTAEIAVSPDGRFLYGSNRGHDSLAVFAVDADSGRLTTAGHVPTGGRTPRHFTIDATGRRLLAANQDSDSVTVFRLDPASGLPSPVGEPVPVPKPVCLLPVPAAR
jgi:6-phosphogluconolactonase